MSIKKLVRREEPTEEILKTIEEEKIDLPLKPHCIELTNNKQALESVRRTWPKSFQSWELLRGRKEFGIITLAGERLSGVSIMEKQVTVDEWKQA